MFGETDPPGVHVRDTAYVDDSRKLAFIFLSEILSARQRQELRRIESPGHATAT